MKVATAVRLPRLGFFLTGAALGLVGCQSGGLTTPEMTRPAAFSLAANAGFQEAEMGDPRAMEGGGDAAKSKDEESSPEEKLEDAIEKRVLAEQKRHYAEVESSLAKLDQEAGEIEVAESLRAKRAALQIARDELGLFGRQKMPLELREADLDVERSLDRRLKAETDLANMREIMSEEAEAKNKGEIIRRYETSLRFAEESLGIEREQRKLVEAGHQAKLAKLSGEVRAAEAKLQAEELHASRKRMSFGLKVLKAKHGVDEAKRKAKKALREEKKLKRKAKAVEGEK